MTQEERASLFPDRSTIETKTNPSLYRDNKSGSATDQESRIKDSFNHSRKCYDKLYDLHTLLLAHRQVQCTRKDMNNVSILDSYMNPVVEAGNEIVESSKALCDVAHSCGFLQSMMEESQAATMI